MSKQKQEAYEQYVEASVALFMGCYAEAMTESLQVQLRQETPESLTGELDEKCRTMIQKGCAKRQRQVLWRALSRGLSFAAAMLVILLAASSALFMTVEAVRLPIINFYIEQGTNHWSLTGDPQTPATEPVSRFDPADPLKGLLPEGYALFKSVELDSAKTVIYTDYKGDSIQLVVNTNSNHLMIDTEETEIATHFTFQNHDAILVKTDVLSLCWLDEKSEIIYTLVVDGFSESELFLLAEEFITKYCS